jgi:hypothetical protein
MILDTRKPLPEPPPEAQTRPGGDSKGGQRVKKQRAAKGN